VLVLVAAPPGSPAVSAVQSAIARQGGIEKTDFLILVAVVFALSTGSAGSAGASARDVRASGQRPVRRDLPLWRAMAARAGGRVLDVGAGTGRVTVELAASGASPPRAPAYPRRRIG